jgi:hypothetical protein
MYRKAADYSAAAWRTVYITEKTYILIVPGVNMKAVKGDGFAVAQEYARKRSAAVSDGGPVGNRKILA